MTEAPPPDSAPAEGKVLRDAAETLRTPALQPAHVSPTQQKQIGLLKRAMKCVDRDPNQALELAQKAVAIDPGFSKAQHVVGLLLHRSGQLSKALEHYEQAWKADPADVDIYQNLGLVAWRLTMLEAAEKFFRLGMSNEPHRNDVLINLTGVLRDMGRFDDAIELLRQAIYAHPGEHKLWNMLGSVLVEAGDPTQAEVFYREAITIKPDFGRAWHNLANSLDIVGRTDEALEAFDNALASQLDAPQDRGQICHAQALCLLSAGRLKEGWEVYDIRTQPIYENSTIFLIPKPRWDRDPASLAGRRVLVIGEQGLGDEVLFANALQDVIDAVGPDGKVLVGVEHRLVSMFKRAYPDAIVGPHATFGAEGRKCRGVGWLEKEGDADIWMPMGDACCVFRPTLDSFPAEPGFLPADPDRVAEMRAQLDALGPGLKAGIIWKSLLMTPNRAKFFSPFQQWAPVLRTPGVHFVNLQYGDVDEELAQADREYGVTIHQIDGLDVKNDLEGVAALGAALDLSMGPMTASTNLAAAAGGEYWVLGYQNQFTFHATDRMPWYPTARIFCPPAWGKWDPAMKKLAIALAERAEASNDGKQAEAAA